MREAKLIEEQERRIRNFAPQPSIRCYSKIAVDINGKPTFNVMVNKKI
jgi:hypothetical protein